MVVFKKLGFLHCLMKNLRREASLKDENHFYQQSFFQRFEGRSKASFSHLDI